MIHRVYTKINSAEELEKLKADKRSAQWWHDSCCRYAVVSDLAQFITEIFLDTDPTKAVKYPQLVCAEVAY